MKIDREYPREIPVEGGTARFALATLADREAVLELIRSVPEHDRLFLRRDLARDEGIDAWLAAHARGELVTLLARMDGRVVGLATIEPERDRWSHHVAELRVLVAPVARGRGMGQVLSQEAFAIALSADLEKLTARMTPDQAAAIRTFEALGFRQEALLEDHVKDDQGSKYDLVVLAHDVARFAAARQAYGVDRAFD